MTKKDRFAVSVSITWVLIIALFAAEIGRDWLSFFCKLGKAFNMLDSIKFFDLKNGPKNDKILPDRYDAKLIPKILNTRNSNDITKN